jgi:hypothetical protein
MTTIPVERLDPRFEALIPLDMSLEVVADFEEREGPHWLEGPAWDRQRGYLLFSDVKANAIWRWQRDGGVQVYMQPSGYTGDRPFAGQEPGSNGLAFDSHGRLLICEHGDRRIRRLGPVDIRGFGVCQMVVEGCFSEGGRLESPDVERWAMGTHRAVGTGQGRRQRRNGEGQPPVC